MDTDYNKDNKLGDENTANLEGPHQEVAAGLASTGLQYPGRDVQQGAHGNQTGLS